MMRAFSNSCRVTHVKIGILRNTECSHHREVSVRFFVFDHVVALPHVEGETYEKLALTRITIPHRETCTINESNPHGIQ
jgi:hypothetical protein